MTLQRYPIPGPYKGIITDMPAATDRQKVDDAQNIMFRKGRLQTRPRFNSIAGPPDGNPILGIYNFLDVTNQYHTLVVTSNTAYFLTNPGTGIVYNALTPDVGAPSPLGGIGLPYAIREINQQVYFSNGSVSLLYVDGEATYKVAGDVPGTPFYLTENSEHLIGVNWIEPSPGTTNSTQFPFRVRWSDVGNPTEWITSVSNTAGATDLVESGGLLTGASTIGRNTYILRQEGATVMYATGNAAQPFQFEPFMWSRPGWGNYFPYSLVTFGVMCVCVTRGGEVIMFDGTNFTRLSSNKVRSRLLGDLNSATGTVTGFMTDTFGGGYDHEAYWLSIPGPNVTWVHDLVEGTWQRITSSAGALTAAAYVGVK